MRSFADEDTHFIVLESDTPWTVDGYNLGEPTGDIKCAECGAVAGNIDEIDHNLVDGEKCDQEDVHSEYFESLHQD